ncbi:MAG TPA: hypothetical protein ENF36_01760, partial [Desulfobacteraceae bacterium]|nr:hypothetical protein [Desulfobacteraceae bacterium]
MVRIQAGREEVKGKNYHSIKELVMDKQELIFKLNRDLADEHAAIIRYLVHGYMEGEDTPLGSSLISISREE